MKWDQVFVFPWLIECKSKEIFTESPLSPLISLQYYNLIEAMPCCTNGGSNLCTCANQQ